MANVYRVSAPLVISKKPDGSDLYLYEGAILPDYLGEADVKRLTDLGFVEKLSATEAKHVDVPTEQSN